MIYLKKKYLIIASLIYIYLPIILFLFGWTKFYFAILCCTVLGYGFKCLWNDYMQNNSDEDIGISGLAFGFLVIFFCVIGYYAGWGNFVNQPGDWYKHNAVMSDLVNKPWPVYYVNENEHSMLTYYIAQYLLPAFIGKIFHSFRVAEVINFIWAEAGLLIVYLNLIRIIKVRSESMQLFASVILIFFSGPLLLAQKLVEIIYPELESMAAVYHWFSEGEILLQYSSNYVMLSWVFPQTLVIWLITLLFLEHKEYIQDYIVLMLPGILFGTLSFLGLIPLAFGVAIEQLVKEKHLKQWLKKVFSPSNLLSLCSFGGIFILYFYGNIISEKPDNISFQMINYEGYWGKYFIFCAIMVLSYAECILSKNLKNVLYYLSVAILIILPLFKMGISNDLVMRCSIPALFLLMFYIISYFYDYSESKVYNLKNKNGNKLVVYVLLVLLFIGSIHPMQEFYDAVITDKFVALGEERNFGTLQNFANRSLEVGEDLRYNYYSYDIENNLFYNYIARSKDNLK